MKIKRKHHCCCCHCPSRTGQKQTAPSTPQEGNEQAQQPAPPAEPGAQGEGNVNEQTPVQPQRQRRVSTSSSSSSSSSSSEDEHAHHHDHHGHRKVKKQGIKKWRKKFFKHLLKQRELLKGGHKRFAHDGHYGWNVDLLKRKKGKHLGHKKFKKMKHRFGFRPDSCHTQCS